MTRLSDPAAAALAESLARPIPIAGSSVPGCACGAACGALAYAHRLEERWLADANMIIRLRNQLRAAGIAPAEPA